MFRRDAAQSLQIAKLQKMLYLHYVHPLSSTWRAEELSDITSAASLSARLAFCSPSAAITWVIGLI